jgi:geranylgeranyl pyrophosphate synthase
LKIRKKSAHLFRDAAYCGALLGSGSSPEIESLSSYGENYGIAYQIRDDLLDLTDSEMAPIETTLPIIHAYEVSDPNRRKRLEEDLQLFVGSIQTSSRIASTRIQKILNDAGSIDYCKEKIVKYIERAIGSVSPLKDTCFKAHLIHMARSLIP